jgi:hypothetical protein
MAFLAIGDADSALSDLQLGFRLANSTRTEPFVFSQFLRDACCDDLLQPIAEGLRRHQFSDAQITQLQHELQPIDLLAAFQLGVRGSRVENWGLTLITPSWKQRIEVAFSAVPELSRPLTSLTWFRGFAPEGWMCQNHAAFCRIYDDYILPAVDIQSRVVAPERARAITNATRQLKGPYSAAASLLFRMQDRLQIFWTYRHLEHVAHAQTQVDEALVACALERCRLARSGYPETLDALVPRFIEALPHDIINGQPLHYHTTNEGSFVLYSVGWNETDDGGLVVRDEDGTVGLEQGDWVWP